MAKMFPPSLPADVVRDPMRSSEVLVYDALKEQLDSQYHVYYSSPWLGTKSDGEEIDGEADFVVAHAEKGILVIEVKGGRVELAADNTWKSTDRHHICRTIKNPVNQARTSKHHILQKLKDAPQWKSAYICMRHGVILPHVDRPARGFRPDMPLKLFAFEGDMNNLDAWVTSRFSAAEEQEGNTAPLGEAGLRALDDMLAKRILLRVRLNSHVRDDMKDILLKTNEQIFILTEMEENHRMAISGAAGTGKTILAMEKAKMLAEEGKRTLLLCFNKPLGCHIKAKMSREPLITASHFHAFSKYVAMKAGNNDADIAPDEAPVELVDNFVEAEIEEYDAVIIDEGQDFHEDWLAALEVCVKDAENGVLYIFYDDNQNVMSGSSAYIRSLPVAKHALRRNFRNTKSIFKQAEPYYKGNVVRCIGPDGNAIKRNPLQKETSLKTLLNERVGTLINSEGIPAEQIAILCPDMKTIETIAGPSKAQIGKYSVTNSETPKTGSVVVETIRRFKGMESPVVLLVLDASTVSMPELIYTGVTRAQVHLELFGSAAALKAFDN
ncbi:MAG: NERD domain-containing protein [Balneolia bacterium]|nr:NERD domain-containing protein [Balneolia bacterium]